MNSLNLLSARVSQPASRSGSISSTLSSAPLADTPSAGEGQAQQHNLPEEHIDDGAEPLSDSEATPLLEKERSPVQIRGIWHKMAHGCADALTNTFRWVVTVITIPAAVVTSCFFDEGGLFAPLAPLRRVRQICLGDFWYRSATRTRNTQADRAHADVQEKSFPKGHVPLSTSRHLDNLSSSESDLSPDDGETPTKGDASRRDMRSTDGTGWTPARRSIRIKLHNEGNIRQRKHGKSSSTSTQSNGAGALPASSVLPSHLKSPTSTAASMMITRYPHASLPPRPLIPRRQPSYSLVESPTKMQKTLILDLDETLIHSMAKGGRMSTGHMVEVKLNVPSMGPQHPILYYVHKRPYCDEFLRKVCKWYNLVIFTASVQEYADPVIDWLELERKFFSARYYRQHCTYRQGAFIKDLSAVEPDLSKVMILDNSPLSYMFHQDNAIPIEGWISDPTDSDLLHLIPLLEGLQYVTDVRAFLALRGGEEGKHSV